MEIEIKYLDRNEKPVLEVISRDCHTRQEVEKAVINHAKSMGSGYFPFFKVLQDQ